MLPWMLIFRMIRWIFRACWKRWEYDAACGWRHRRNDPFIKLVSSRIANYVRNKLSNEEIIDVGCSLKAFKAAYVKKLKLYSGMHRFFPTLIKMEGGRVAEVKVNHRPESTACRSTTYATE